MIIGIFAIVCGLLLSFFATQAKIDSIEIFGPEFDPDEDLSEFKELNKKTSYGDLSMPVMTLGLALFLIVIARRVRRIKK